jgi:hypothetical protein
MSMSVTRTDILQWAMTAAIPLQLEYRAAAQEQAEPANQRMMNNHAHSFYEIARLGIQMTAKEILLHHQGVSRSRGAVTR